MAKGDTRRPPDSQAGLAYLRLLELLLDGQIPSGVPLNERGLATLVGVSRTPLRTAIGRLVSKGLLAKNSHGAMIEQVDLQRIAEIFALRRVLEVDAAGLAANCPETHRIIEVQSELVAASSARRSSGYESWQADDRFHRVIEDLAGNRFAASIMGDFRLLIHVLAGKGLRRRREGSSSEEHKAILAAIQRRDADAARKAMDDHLAAERNALLDIPMDR